MENDRTPSNTFREQGPGQTAARLGHPRRFLEVVDSTNSEAWRWLEQGAPEGAVVVANSQTQGRGRQGRRWESGSGQGLWLSVILRPRLDPAQRGWIGAMAALAVLQALEDLWRMGGGPGAGSGGGQDTLRRLAARGPCNAQFSGASFLTLKWPNDVLAGGRKIAGILAEQKSVPGQGDTPVVLGIGINIRQRPEDFPPALRDAATSLRQCLGHDVPLPLVEERLLVRLGEQYGRLQDGRVEELRRCYCRHLSTLGQYVQLVPAAPVPGAAPELGSLPLRGRAEDVDLLGRLVIRQESGEAVAVSAGDVHTVSDASSAMPQRLASEESRQPGQAAPGPGLQALQEWLEARPAPIRLVALDLDGTALDPQSRPTPALVAAVQALRRCGVRVVLATGRSLAATSAFAWDIRPDQPLILLNGAVIYDLPSGRPLVLHHLPLELSREIIGLGVELGLHPFVRQNFFQGDGIVTEASLPWSQRHHGYFAGFSSFGRIPGLADQLPGPPLKILFLEPEEDIRRLQEELQRRSWPLEVLVYGEPGRETWGLEVFPAGVSKGSGLAFVAQLFGLHPEQVAALGDDTNDMAMLQWAGLGIAMGNAGLQVREVADFVAPANNEDGAAQILQVLLSVCRKAS